MKNKNTISNIIVYIMLSLFGFVFIYPFLWMIVISIDKTAVLSMPLKPALMPNEFTLSNYRMAIERIKLGRLYLNSLNVAGITLLISIASAMLAGYSISKIRFSGSKLVLLLCLGTMMIPFEAVMIPLFLLFKKLSLINSFGSFYLTAIAYPFGIFLIKQYFDTLPDTLREAAKIDGAGELRIFYSIFVPLCSTILATVAVLHFLSNWNSFLWPLIVLTDPKKYTLQIGMAMFKNSIGMMQGGDYVAYPAMTMAGNILGLLPVLAIFLYLQRYIIQSVALSGIKQ